MAVTSDPGATAASGARSRCRSYAASRQAAFTPRYAHSVARESGIQVEVSCAGEPAAGALLAPAPAHCIERPPERSTSVHAALSVGKTTKERFYRPELDVLRLIAFLMVWCAHASLAFRGLLPARVLSLVDGAGSLGVPVFFFLSAYLITELLRREHALTGAVDLGGFYMRRILRIWPLYFGLLTVYGLLGLRFHGFRIEPGRLVASALMTGNWYIARHPHITTPLRHLWSISVEEQWYLLWPIVAIAPTRRRLLLFCAGLFLASQITLAWLACGHVPWVAVTAWVNSGVQFQFLALGAATALLLNGRIPRIAPLPRVGLATLAAVAFLPAAGSFAIKQEGIVHSPVSLCSGYLCAGVGSACLFFALLGVAPRRCPPALVRLGQLSYGLYVLHETGVFLAGAAMRRISGLHAMHLSLPQSILFMLFALALTVGLAFASYYAWELPFLRLKERWTVVRSRVAA